MIAIARGITRFDGRAAFSTWCYRIATNAALDELRRKRRRPVPAEADPGAVVARGSGPDDVVAARVDVDAALRAVPEDFRVAVVLRDLCDLDYAEIAAVLDVPVGTVRSRINRGRAILVERLGSPAAGNRTPASGRRNDDG
jgi:RNA polymerase sigma-70 factor (ECF subfamily)